MAFATNLDEQINLLIACHGALEVRQAATRLTKQKVGRKAEKDGALLAPWYELDAVDWLAGRDPFALRSNYSIARDFTKKYPGHSPTATHKRISRKLSKNRRLFMLFLVHQKSEADFPAEVHLQATRELLAIKNGHPWDFMLESALGKIQRYRERFGEPPADMSLAQIEEKNREAKPVTLADLISNHPKRRTGMFGGVR